MKIFFLVLAVLMAAATQLPSSFSKETEVFLNVLILIGAGMAAYTAGSLDR